jgi:phage-related protein
MSWTVEFFQTARGSYPVKEFILEQDKTTAAKILHAINLLSNNGPFLKPPYIKKLQDRLYELRISGKIAVRILYTISNNEYFLLHAFTKKTQKTPSKELKTTLDRMKEII